MSSLETLSTQFTKDVATGAKASSDLSTQLREDLQSIQGFLGPESTLVKQLAHCMNSYQDLNQNFGTIQPALSALHVSVESLAATEGDIFQDLRDFGKQLADARVNTSNPGLEKEISAKFAENTQLQLQVQGLSSEGDSLRRELNAKVAEMQDVRLSLVDVSGKLQVAETRNQQLERDNLSFQSEIAFAAQRTQEERDNCTTLSDQIKAQYEQQLQSLQREKENFEKGTEELISQLGGVRDSLVGVASGQFGPYTDSLKIEAKGIIDDQRKERESLVRSQLPDQDSANLDRPRKQSSRFKNSILPTLKLWFVWTPRPARSNGTKKWRPIPVLRKVIFEKS